MITDSINSVGHPIIRNLPRNIHSSKIICFFNPITSTVLIIKIACNLNSSVG